MIPLDIQISNGPDDQIWTDDEPGTVLVLPPTALRVAILRGGMASGKTSVMIRLDTPAGSFVVENSGRNIVAFARMIGDE